MKFLAFLLLLVGSHQVGAVEGLNAIANHHRVVSDKKSNEVPAGKCLIRGKVLNSNTNEPIASALVAPLNKITSANSDSTGAYSLLINSSDTSIFAYNSEFGEYVIWNYNFQDQHLVELNFYLGPEIERRALKKPVIYLYSEEDLKASISLEFKGELTFTYPILEDSWEVSIQDNRTYVEDVEYPYLFWEGDILSPKFHKEENNLTGSLLKSEDVLSFLTSNLTALGLNSRETADFVTFWMPELTNKPFVFIQFLTDQQLDTDIAALNVVPKPDNMRRVYMLFETFNTIPEDLNFVPQTFTDFERNGFHIVEWGGCNVTQSKHQF